MLQPIINLQANPLDVGSLELAHLINALRDIVLETMDYSPARRMDSDSYLPPALIAKAQEALEACGRRVQHDPGMVAA